ncbi:RNA ligase [Staphylococcus phage Twort]|uniref:RNA ligase n=2 Tax=Staphylococcus phage Twort (strain DSM 17442 / HER 48) TaxID=2908167 RepID=A0A6H0X539_BPTWO|nr:RNA ligase [Staphylococcus phage Twort]AAX92304.1 ORF008 [Staphylococcus phage Twort]QIW89035.1 RNA ligase [Staphylococcus phage Twort]
MRQLVLLRGVPGVGKSTYIKENGLEQFTLSPDVLRTQCGSPVYNTKGQQVTTQENDNYIWTLLLEILEQRMIRGDFTVIDATHSTSKLIKKYEKLARKYRYRTYVVTLEEDLDTLLERNKNRESHKQVPEEVIENMYDRLQHENIPSYAKSVDKDNLLDTLKWDKDFMKVDHYNKIHVIGDVHSCFTVLSAFASVNKILDNPNELFIFVGDYFDRGIETKEVFEYLELICKQPNVILLEGNHERHLRNFIYLDNQELEELTDIYEDKDEFFNKAMKVFRARGFISTLRSFIKFGITQKRIKTVVEKLQQLAYFTYKGQDYVITHGGIMPQMLDNLNMVSTHQIINGVGGYEFDIDSEWDNSDTIQIHGHRNLYRQPLDTYKDSINLEGRVEKGGHLRAVTIDEDNSIMPHEIKNPVYNEKLLLDTRDHLKEIDPELTVETYLNIAKEDRKTIKVKPTHDDIVSVNFTKHAFTKKNWNQLSVTARGLFIREDDHTVVGRGYPKFFNINEMNETKLENLPDTLSFPVDVYEKENGFLGLMFYDEKRDEIIYASKSSTHLSKDNEYALMFKTIVENSKIDLNTLKETLKYSNSTFVFEVIDIENDPHIIEYNENKIVLLDIIKNELQFNKLPYKEVKSTAQYLGLPYKKQVTTLNTWVEFYNFVTEDNKEEIEGYVFEDSNKFMVKQKLEYYNNWKYMRGLISSVAKSSGNRPKQYILQKDKTLREFYYWLEKQDKNYLKENRDNIVGLRKEFLYEV